eukprot:snap_masked-scaffold_112-processed-gene-0.0-mRNA-1 protein AED:1.00 eAED:1.00 QI:0/-1/0/0/-1/1/1/0/87
MTSRENDGSEVVFSDQQDFVVSANGAPVGGTEVVVVARTVEEDRQERRRLAEEIIKKQNDNCSRDCKFISILFVIVAIIMFLILMLD